MAYDVINKSGCTEEHHSFPFTFPFLFDGEVGLPTAIPQAASNIGATSARINGKITDDGGASCEARFRWRRESDEDILEVDSWTGSTGEDNARAVCDDGTNLYVAVDVNPALIKKIDVSDMSVVATWDGTGVLFNIWCLYSDGIYLYAGGSSNNKRGRVAQISLATFTTVDYWDAQDLDDSNNVLGITGDGSYIYCSLQTTEQDVAEIAVKLDPSDMSWVDSYIGVFNGGGTEGNAWDIEYLNSYVYLSCNSGHLLKIDCSDMTRTANWIPSGKQLYRVCTDGTYIYCVVYTTLGSTYAFHKIDVSTMTSIGNIARGKVEQDLQSLAPYVYVCSKTDVHRFDPTTMTMDSGNPWTAATAFAELHIFGGYFFYARWSIPASVYKLGLWNYTEWQNTLETNDEYYEDLTELDPDTEYEFQTQPKNSAGEGAWSASAYFETPITLLITPSPAQAIGSVVAPTVLYGSTTATPDPAESIAQVIQPNVQQGNIIFSPAVIDALAKAVNPFIMISPVMPDPISAIASVVNPIVVLSSISITPTSIEAIGQVVAPIVSVAGVLYVTPAAIDAIGGRVNPTVILGSIAITPDALSAIAQVAIGNVRQGNIIFCPAFVKALGKVVAPTIIGGQLILEPESIEAIARGENPEVILASMTITPEFIKAIAGAVAPYVLQAWVGRKLRLVIVTSQYRKVNVTTCQKRKVNIVTGQKRKVRIITGA